MHQIPETDCGNPKRKYQVMTTQISLFNHKGGVSKTTTAFNLGWMLASKGKRVLLIDCDPQCNLTGMFLGFTGIAEIEEAYKGGGVRNIRDGLAPAFESKPIPLKPVVCEIMRGQENLLLLPGHIGLAEYETTLGIAQELSGSLVTLQNLPGAPSTLFKLTALQYKIDIIIVDMSPSLGPINQNLLATSDFFIVPMAPDYFSVMATDLSQIFSRNGRNGPLKRNLTKYYKPPPTPCQPAIQSFSGRLFRGIVCAKALLRPRRFRGGSTQSTRRSSKRLSLLSKRAVCYYLIPPTLPPECPPATR